MLFLDHSRTHLADDHDNRRGDRATFLLTPTWGSKVPPFDRSVPRSLVLHLCCATRPPFSTPEGGTDEHHPFRVPETSALSHLSYRIASPETR
jgi:hypothetical protein